MINYFTFFISLVIGILCDVVVVLLLSSSIEIHEILFFRFLGAALFLRIFIKNRVRAATLHELLIYFTRGGLLFLAMYLWIFGLSGSSVSNASFFNFIIPVFTILFASFFLKETLTPLQVFLVIGIFCVSCVFFYIKNLGFSVEYKYNLFLIFSAMLFAFVEVINKKLLSKFYIEDAFFVCLSIAIFTLPFFIKDFRFPNFYDLLLLSALGCLNALMYYCLFRTYKFCKISIIAALRYLEFPLAIAADKVIFAKQTNIFEIGLFLLLIIITSVLVKTSQQKTSATSLG